MLATQGQVPGRGTLFLKIVPIILKNTQCYIGSTYYSQNYASIIFGAGLACPINVHGKVVEVF